MQLTGSQNTNFSTNKQEYILLPYCNASCVYTLVGTVDVFNLTNFALLLWAM